MKEDDARNTASDVSTLERGVRIDLIIAVCALLISSLATGASWWQARVLQEQTKVLQEQLGAQVWPYVSISEGITNDTVQITIGNDGLGPAVLRSASATVDGVPKATFIDVMHAIIGPNIVGRVPRGEKISLTLNGGSPGSVLRPGDSNVAFGLRSKRFAPAFLNGYRRINFQVCYCAIIPGKCWLSTFNVGDPQAVGACHEVPNDLLHASPVEALTKHNF